MLEKYQINIYVLCITIAPHASSWKKKTLINKCKYHIVYTVQVYKLSEYRKYTHIYSNILFSMRNTATYIYFKLAVKLYQNINDCLYDTDNQNQDPPPIRILKPHRHWRRNHGTERRVSEVVTRHARYSQFSKWYVVLSNPLHKSNK